MVLWFAGGDITAGHCKNQVQCLVCQKEGVPRAIFTHCGTEFVTGDEEKIEALISGWEGDRRQCASGF
jgi:hypothetical protein